MELKSLVATLLMGFTSAMSAQGSLELTGDAVPVKIRARSPQGPPSEADLTTHIWWNCDPFWADPTLDVCVCRKDRCQAGSLGCQGILVARGDCDENCNCSALPDTPPAEPPTSQPPAPPPPPPPTPPPPAEPPAPPPAEVTVPVVETQAPQETSKPPPETMQKPTTTKEGEPKETGEEIDPGVEWKCSPSDGRDGEGLCACNPPENCWHEGTECYGLVVDMDQGHCSEDCAACKPLQAGFTEKF